MSPSHQTILCFDSPASSTSPSSTSFRDHSVANMAGLRKVSIRRKKGPDGAPKLKLNIRDTYGGLIDTGEEDDEMDEWVMSLNVDDITKQRKERAPPHFQRSRPTISRGLDQTAFHQAWHDHHMVKANDRLRIGLTKQGRERMEMMTYATRSYNLAEEHQPASTSLLINRCIALEELGDLIRASADAERAVDMEADNTKALYRLARTYRLSGEALKADFMYKKCFELSCAIEVWHEMTESRLEYLIRSEGCTAEQVDDAHILADSLTEACLFVKAVRDHAAESEERVGTSATTEDQVMRTMQLSLSATSDFIILDLEEQVKKFNSFLTPSNIFQTKGVFLYDCSCRDDAAIRNAFRKCGPISSVLITDDCVKIMFPDLRGAVTAISLMAGSISSGLTEEHEVLTVRFAFTSTNDVKSMNDMIRICTMEGQCLGWRTTGCHLKKLCKFRHLEADFRVDQHPFMQQATSCFQKAAEMQHSMYRRMTQKSNQMNGTRDEKPARLILGPRRTL